jgi:hypothetical protein
MRQWLEAGYFKGDLPISQQSSGPFMPLSALFPDSLVAFRGVTNSVAKEEAEASAPGTKVDKKRQQKPVEEERRPAEAVAAKAEQEADERKMAETERLASKTEITVAAAASNGGNKSSNKLKMMLGLSSSSEVALTEEPGNSVEIPAPTVSSKRQSAEKRLAKGSEKAQPKSADRRTEPAVSESTSKSSVAWGGAGTAKPKKSMSEIQQEEARAAAIIAMQRDGMPRQSSSGWANVAASGKSGWTSGTLKQNNDAANINAVPNSRQLQAQVKTQNPTQVNAARESSPISQQQRSNPSSSSTPAEEFGTTMSPSLEKWCKEQMHNINGSDDLTLVAFCMTLEDANEIRQYLTTYLGSTSQVNNFATEFINKRGLGNRQEEWETPGSAKKGRKKKAGGR